MNIMDGMDAARFKSANPHAQPRSEQIKDENTGMPLVLRDLNNKPQLDPASPQEAYAQMSRQPPLEPDEESGFPVNEIFTPLLT